MDNAIVIDKSGVLNAEGLRFSDEFVRHKILDLIGDMALLGCGVLGHFTASKAGHALHLQLMQEIMEHPECWKLVTSTDKVEDSVLEKVVSSTKAAGNKIMPYLLPPKIATSCVAAHA